MGQLVIRVFAPQVPKVVELIEQEYSYSGIGDAHSSRIEILHVLVFNVSYKRDTHKHVYDTVHKHLRITAGIGLAAINYGSVGRFVVNTPIIAHKPFREFARYVVQGDEDLYRRYVR